VEGIEQLEGLLLVVIVFLSVTEECRDMKMK